MSVSVRKQALKRTGFGAAKSWFFTFLLLFVILTLYRGVATMYGKFSRAGELRNAATAELSELNERKNALETDLGQLSSERGVEEELRNRFNVAKDGENVIHIVDDRE